jgi:hypothetical protein
VIEGDASHATKAGPEEGHVHSNRSLCGDPHKVVQKFWCEVCAITPDNSVKLGMQLEPSEHRDIPQRLKDRTIEFVTKINVPFETVVEADVNDEISNPFGFRNSDHRLLQRWDRIQRLALLRSFPILCQFRLVQLIPLEYVTERPSRKLTCHDSILYPNLDLVFAVNCMKMRWLVILVEHRNHNAEKAAQLRHMSF